MPNMKFFCLAVALCASSGFAHLAAQTTADQTDAATSATPVAYVYVSSNPKGSSTNEILAFAAAANGKLTPVTGSPFRDDVTSMAVNGRRLFASTR
ncbi:MAG TPA: hypothetical protein VF018_04210, partial [Acidobacteriaceae bacterium]